MMIVKTLLIALAAIPGSAKTPQDSRCREVVYENNNQVDPQPLIVQEIKGIATDPQQVPIPKVCVGVFTTPDHRLVASAESDDQGRFFLPNVPPGQYRLVAKYDSFCAPNVSLRVVRSHKKNKPLHVHMRTPALDSCSYIDLAKWRSVDEDPLKKNGSLAFPKN